MTRLLELAFSLALVICAKGQELSKCPEGWEIQMQYVNMDPTYGPGSMVFNASLPNLNTGGYVGVPQVGSYQQDSSVNSGEQGRIDVITGCDSETECCKGPINIQGRMPLRNPYKYKQTPLTITLQGDACGGSGQSGCYISDTFVHPPTCTLYAVDCSYCGDEGLVTDDNKASFVLGCTHAVDICDDCIGIKGPTDAKLDSLSLLSETNSFYSIIVSWEQDYQGKVEVGVICDLKSTEDGKYLEEAVLPASFSVMPKGSVLVKTTAFRVNDYSTTK
eukprot:TRINITY_DN17368_c0_g1_i1.p1 TRINITY_DN17368_c0_g1~~TRINITY_DN17368_c0_g1_i1.p1  ORF type:complete len:276 (+),score=39.13 TRINITY_DN17368_c0_g1_i1:230-1057(+)